MNVSTRYTEYTAPSAEPITTADLKTHCRVDISDDDTYIAALGVVARRHVENVTGLKLINATWDVYYSTFGNEMVMPFAPLGSITSVKYYDTAGTQQTLASSVYESGSRYGVPSIRLAYNQTWPAFRGHDDDVVCRVVFGYGSAGTSVPGELLHAIKLIVGHLYENREPVNIGNIVNTLPMAVDALLAPFKIHHLIC